MPREQSSPHLWLVRPADRVLDVGSPSYALQQSRKRSRGARVTGADIENWIKSTLRDDEIEVWLQNLPFQTR